MLCVVAAPVVSVLGTVVTSIVVVATDTRKVAGECSG
jgi:hypothetical protein